MVTERKLTLEQLRKANVDPTARSYFRKRFGEEAVVTESWATKDRNSHELFYWDDLTGVLSKDEYIAYLEACLEASSYVDGDLCVDDFHTRAKIWERVYLGENL